MGVTMSLLTENQIVAALLSYVAISSGILFSWLAFISTSPWDSIFANFLYTEHMKSFRLGLIFIGDIAMYLCVAGLFLVFGYWKLRGHYRK